MGTSPIFNSTPSRPTTEQDILEKLIIEAINLVGTNVYYLPRNSRSTPDKVYGEDPVSLFDRAVLMPMYLNSFLGPTGPSEIFSKFGMAISDSHKYIIARRTFQASTGLNRPMEGDLIWVPAFNDLVEIKFVEQEHTFYPLARRAPLFYYYELSVENVKISSEKFATGVQEIDKIGRDYNYTINLALSAMANTANLNFALNEPVFQANTGFTAIVKNWDEPTMVLQITNAEGVLAANNAIHGNTSGATYSVGSYDYRDFSGVLEQVFDNVELESEAQDVLDLNTDNPFGSP